MLLREYLEEHTRDELLGYARSIELKKCSGLRKAELIEKKNSSRFLRRKCVEKQTDLSDERRDEAFSKSM